MGGSVAVHVAATKAVPKLAGLVVVDVVEVCVNNIFFLVCSNYENQALIKI